uniref:Uncharacterized protein n=1 Tax=Meloidogyne floridensis TaxID=298350 RepID=A0A915NZH8_9BILA
MIGKKPESEKTEEIIMNTMRKIKDEKKDEEERNEEIRLRAAAMAESIKPAVLQQILASAQGVHSDNTNCNCLICVVKKFVSTPETTTTNSGSKNKHNCSNTTNTSSTTNTISTSTAGSSNPIRGNNQKPIAVPSKDIKSTETDTSDDDDDDWPPPHKKFVVVKKTLCPINKFCVPCNWIRSNPTSDTAVKTKPVLAEQQTPRRPRSPSTPRIGSARRSPPIAAHKRPHSSRNDNNNKKKPEVKNQILEVQKSEAEKIAEAKKKGESVRKAAQLAEVYSQIGQTSRACAALFERLAALIKE